MTDLVIPNSVSSIGWSAFSGCSGLTSVTIPRSINEIGVDAFQDCTSLTSVYYGTDNPIAGDKSIFDESTYQKATLYMTEIGALMAGTVDPWKNFVNIAEYDFSAGIDEIVVGVSDINYDAPYEVYNFGGVKVGYSTDNLAPGLYIIRQGRIAKKIMKN